MAPLALGVSITALLFAMLAWFQILPFSRGYRAVEQWLWARQVIKLERSLDERQKGNGGEGPAA